MSNIPIDRLRLKYDNSKEKEGKYKLPTKGFLYAKKRSWFSSYRNLGEYILWFVILTLFFFFIFYFWLPDFFQKQTGGVVNGEANTVKILIVSVLLSAVIIILLVWFKFI